MADAAINFITTDDTVQRNLDFVCNFQITSPKPTDTISKTYVMTNLGTLDTGTQYKLEFSKNDWISISDIEGQDDSDGVNQDIVVSGVPKVRYKYKVELVEANILLKDYGEEYLEIDITDSITLTSNEFANWNPYNIKITVQQDNGTIVTGTKTVHVYDTKPVLQSFEILNNNMVLNIQDNESDGIRYRIKLNGTQIYPVDSDYTELQASPVNLSMTLPRQYVVPKETNTVVIEGMDSYGQAFTSTNTFIGDYIGLLFSDENGEYYTTDLGVLLKYLEFGAIRAGTTSSSKKVIVSNLTGTSITNLNLTLDKDKTIIPEGTAVLLSKDDSDYSLNVLEWNDLIINTGTKEFYVKLQIDALAYGTGIFEITVNAAPA